MEPLAHTTLDEILEEFDDDPVALATEVLALRRVVEELRQALQRDEPVGPIVVLSPPSEPATPEPEPRWPLRPRMAAS